MKVVVITGSTRGIGYGLAEAFLEQGCAVVVSGRSAAAVEHAVAQLAQRHEPPRLLGQPCDVTIFEEVQALWAAAVRRFGRVDVWINNAGLAHPDIPFWQQPPAVMRAVVETNMLGMLYGCKVALEGLAAQGGGAIYNFEGFGSNDMMRPGLTTYGTTKRALRYFTRSLERECQGGPVRIGTISPGIVATDMIETELGELTGDARVRARRLYNILGDRVETVAPWLAAQVLADTRHASRIAWLTPGKAFTRFLTARIKPRDVFSAQPQS